MGNALFVGRGHIDRPLKFTYTGNWAWYDDHTIALLDSGILQLNQNVYADVFMVAGGAGGGIGRGAAGFQGGGGGSGYCVSASISLTKHTAYPAIIGAGGAASTDGGSTSFREITVPGGKAGENYTTGIGGDGSSGGGAGCYGGGESSKPGGNGGFDGSDGGNANNTAALQGKGQGITTRAFGDPAGKLFAGAGSGGGYDWNARSYGGEGGGGDAAWASYVSGTVTYYPAQNGEANTGGGGGGGSYRSPGAGAGGSGIILLRSDALLRPLVE